MTVHIEGAHVAILVIACVVGYGIYSRSRTPSAPGNAAEAIMVAAAVVSALMLILTGVDEVDGGRSTPTEPHSPAVSEQPSAAPSQVPAP